MGAGKLVRIVPRRDIRFENDTEQPVSAIMTPKQQLVTVKEGASSDEVQRLLHQFRIEKILVIDDDFTLKGLITVSGMPKYSPPKRISLGSGKVRLKRSLVL